MLDMLTPQKSGSLGTSAFIVPDFITASLTMDFMRLLARVPCPKLIPFLQTTVTGRSNAEFGLESLRPS